MSRKHNRLFTTAAAVLAVGIAWGGTTARAQPAVVLCTAGHSIANALQRSDEIVVVGTCAGDVVITRDGTSLSGHHTLGGAIDGGIAVLSAQRVEIRELTVTGGTSGAGISASKGASVTVVDVTVEPIVAGALDLGIGAAFNATVELNGVTVAGAATGVGLNANSSASINDSGISGSSDQGIAATRNSSIEMTGSTLSGGPIGILVEDGSSLLLSNSELESAAEDALLITASRAASVRLTGGNTISATGPGGFTIAMQNNVSLLETGENGVDVLNGLVEVGRGTLADFRAIQLTGDIDLFEDAGLRVRNRTGIPGATMITGNVFAFGDTYVFFQRSSSRDLPFTVDGAVFCGDDESSTISSFAVTVTGGVNCSGF